ncbi:Tex family protein [Planctomycetota bacterium]
MNEPYFAKIAQELAIKPTQVTATAKLLEEGATVPFIARYRKEITGSLDEVAIAAIRDRLAQLAELDARRETVLKTIDEQGKLTDELKAKILAAETLTALEDLYLPYKPKRRTRATVAKEKGLEPLAELILAQAAETDPLQAALTFVDEEKGVVSTDEALAGARDIIAEWINEDADTRADVRGYYHDHGSYACHVIKGKENDGKKFQNYFDWSELVKKAPSHRVLAMRRGENEGFLRLRVTVDESEILRLLEKRFVKDQIPCGAQVLEAAGDCLKRLLGPSIETEIRVEGKKMADAEAIKVFAENLRQLLLASPMGQKRLLAIDPGFRTGCKIVCLDAQGQLLHDDVIYPFQSPAQAEVDVKKLTVACKKFDIEIIAIGNGTASRETEAFVRGIDHGRDIPVVLVNESGASVYSASAVAREEFPDKDITVRGAVSIGRRLMDPLAELVKIDPKSIGVGQYQHDVEQGQLKHGLDDVVVSCVNSVGVELNTASKQLLTYVSGLGPVLAQNIVDYRNEHGAFNARQDLLNIPRLGAKAFEQAGGFLRIRDASHPLDASAVHPESYSVVDRMAEDVGCSVADLMGNAPLREKVQLDQYVTDAVGLPTLNDIMAELAKPGRDPRQKFEIFRFAEGVDTLADVKVGMTLPGIVTNITKFGCFVDIGVHQDGLVHISQLSDKFVPDPADIVKVQQKVMVTVLEVDVDRKRIGLTMKNGNPNQGKEAPAREKTRPSHPNKPRPKPQAKGRPKPIAKPRPQEQYRSRGSNGPIGDSLNIKL